MNNNILELQFQMIRNGIEEMKECEDTTERTLQAETLQIVLDNLQRQVSGIYNKGFEDGCKHAEPAC